MFEQVITQLALVALFVERVIALVKPLYQNYEKQALVDKALSVVVSAVLAVVWQIDVFAVAGILLPAYAGFIVTGVVAGLGSNLMHDLIELLKLYKEWQKPA